MIDKAKAFALQSHGAQPYGSRLHIDHLQEVEDTLIEFSFFYEPLCTAAWLHDVVEDTSVTLEDLRAEGFSEIVIHIVDLVTNQRGKNRRERNTTTYPRIVSDNNAVTLKLADRISNVRATVRDHDSKFTMYKKEYPGFRLALYKYTIHDQMWAELDKMLM